jgi:hypothetical protein
MVCDEDGRGIKVYELTLLSEIVITTCIGPWVGRSRLLNVSSGTQRLFLNGPERSRLDVLGPDHAPQAMATRLPRPENAVALSFAPTVVPQGDGERWRLPL